MKAGSSPNSRRGGTSPLNPQSQTLNPNPCSASWVPGLLHPQPQQHVQSAQSTDVLLLPSTQPFRCHLVGGVCRVKREPVERCSGLLTEIQGQNLALTVLCVPCSLDSGSDSQSTDVPLLCRLCARVSCRHAALPRSITPPERKRERERERERGKERERENRLRALRSEAAQHGGA